MNNIQKINEDNKPSLREVFQTPNVQKMLIGTLGSRKDTFVANVLSATSNNLQLKTCDSLTVISAALIADNLKLSLSPQLGYAYLVPFNDRKNKRTVATFVLGYRGYIQLAQRSGQYRCIRVTEVKEGEKLNYNPFTGVGEFRYIDDEEMREKTKTIGYYFYFELLNGYTHSDYWSVEKMKKHAIKYSSGYRSDLDKGTKYTFWATDFDGQAKKTMIRLGLSKWGVMSVDMLNAFNADTESMKIIDEDATIDSEIENNANQGERLSFSNYDAEELGQEEQKEQVLDDVVEEYVKYSEQKTPQQATSKKSYF